VTITENTTLTVLSLGEHSLIVYAKDTAGNTGTSETIYFSVAQKTEPRTRMPTRMLLLECAFVVGFAIALTVIIMIIVKEIQKRGKKGNARDFMKGVL